jgi:hypothetical protein
MNKPMLNQTSTGRTVLQQSVERQCILGKSYLVRRAFENKDLNALWLNLRNKLLQNPFDAAVLLDMSVILLLIGKKQESMKMQIAALELCKIYHIQKTPHSGLRVVVFMAPGDFMSNTPFEFLLENSNFNLIQVFIDGTSDDLSLIPDHDIALMAISESERNRPILEKIAQHLKFWYRPIINNQPEKISQLTRDGVAALFRTAELVIAPSTIRMTRQDLANKKLTHIAIETAGENEVSLIRPIDTHAGEGLQKLSSDNDLANYVRGRKEECFYLSPFIDYKNEDGLYRKYRIAFIDGKPFPSHLAISSHWMVHYLNADMAMHQARRKEEEAWFESFSDFAAEHTQALTEICETIALDYFVIDCAILSDRRILLFEADVAMIVHDMDPVDIYPYKKQAMQKLFDAFQDFLERMARNRTPYSSLESQSTPTFLLN